MHKKIISLIFSLLGTISLFLPYTQAVVIGCGTNFCTTNYYYDSFIELFPNVFDRPLNFATLMEAILQLLVCFSLIFSSIVNLLNGIKTAIFFVVLTLVLMVIAFNDDVCFGYYVIVLQQILLLLYILYSKNKFKLN